MFPGKDWVPGRGYTNVVSPSGWKVNNTCCLYVHGGGFVNSSPDSSYRPFTMKLAKQMKLELYVPDYTLAPKAHYPVQVQQVIHLARILKKSYKHIVLMGDSAGGTIALSATLTEPGLFSRCIFLSPWVNLYSLIANYSPRSSSVPRIDGCTDPVFVGTAGEIARRSAAGAMEYLKDRSLLLVAPANPAQASSEQLKRLPPSLFMVGDRETLRSEVLAFAGRAQKVNAHITAQLYDGMWHDWPMYSEGCGGPPVSLALAAQQSIANYARYGKPGHSSSPTTVARIYLTKPEDSLRPPSKPSRKPLSRGSQTQGRKRSGAKKRTRRTN